MASLQNLPPTGIAVEGQCVPPPSLWVPSAYRSASRRGSTSAVFAVDSEESFVSPQEQRFFDWGIGILEDAGIVGLMKHEYLYRATALHAEIHNEGGWVFSVSLTRTSVGFHHGSIHGHPESGPIHYSGSEIETGGEDLEASQVRKAYCDFRRQSALLRAWNATTHLASTSFVGLRDLRLLVNDTQIAMEVETSLGECTVTIDRTSKSGVFRYTLANEEHSTVHTARVADALLSDAAEDVGGHPEPSSILFAMIGAAVLAQRDTALFASGPERPQNTILDRQ
ncbi:hypothetical protein QFZ30_003053 [Arthrobacter pascens]|uniref:hypothetical protein n=1 Tax=Arthrobacter pascens TaxID=1677 RepID=UPI00278D16E3|nr:hypothetical protein [Arthrobacter pascens]MDQ0679671.1 hypothetical protein [Arthrobacter pascens]